MPSSLDRVSPSAGRGIQPCRQRLHLCGDAPKFVRQFYVGVELQFAIFVRNVQGLLVRLEILDHGGDQLADLGRKHGPIRESLSTRLFLVHELKIPGSSMGFLPAELESTFGRC
jgi:hypothetical protein